MWPFIKRKAEYTDHLYDLTSVEFTERVKREHRYLPKYLTFKTFVKVDVSGFKRLLMCDGILRPVWKTLLPIASDIEKLLEKGTGHPLYYIEKYDGTYEIKELPSEKFTILAYIKLSCPLRLNKDNVYELNVEDNEILNKCIDLDVTLEVDDPNWDYDTEYDLAYKEFTWFNPRLILDYTMQEGIWAFLDYDECKLKLLRLLRDDREYLLREIEDAKRNLKSLEERYAEIDRTYLELNAPAGA